MKFNIKTFYKIIRSLADLLNDLNVFEKLEIAELMSNLAKDQFSDDTNTEPTIDELVLFKTKGKMTAVEAHRSRTGLSPKESYIIIQEGAAKLGIEDFISKEQL
jgi:hypothetical protein